MYVLTPTSNKVVVHHSAKVIRRTSPRPTDDFPMVVPYLIFTEFFHLDFGFHLPAGSQQCYFCTQQLQKTLPSVHCPTA